MAVTPSPFCSKPISSVESFDPASVFGEPFAQDLLHPPLRDDQRTGVGDIRRREAIRMHVVIAEHGGSVVAAKGQVETSVRQYAVNRAKVFEHFQTAGLQPLPPRSPEVFRRLVDNPPGRSAAGKNTSQREPGGACSHDQHGNLRATHRCESIACAYPKDRYWLQ
jgi:hypothetical protein